MFFGHNLNKFLFSLILLLIIGQVPSSNADIFDDNPINSFGLDLFQAISAQQPDQNIFISPLSISLALAMTSNGAVGITASEMREVLSLDGFSDMEINQMYQEIMNSLYRQRGSQTLELANSIWIDKGFPVLQDFIDLNRDYFRSQVSKLDFSHPDAADIINRWVSENTHAKITDLLSSPIDPDVVMYLINTIYFLGQWQYKFDFARTITEPFYQASGTLGYCQMMKLSASLSAVEAENFTAVTLPYADGDLAMTVIHPDYGIDINEFLLFFRQNLGPEFLENFSYRKTNLWLPKFKLKYKTELSGILSSLGMPSAFGAGADFSGITRNSGIYISRVLHSSFIQVDEEGTEAAATTAVEMKKSIHIEKPLEIHVDSPFIFIIHSQLDNSILFMGKIIVPVWEE